MAVLVGGVGYIGAALAGQLLTVGEEVVGFDNFFSTDRRAVAALCRHGGFRFVEGDLAEPEHVARAFAAADVRIAYLLAAQASPDDRAAPIEYAERTNLRGPRVFLEECASRGVESVVLGSSLRVYGQPLPPDFDESTPYGRQSDLSHLSKIYAEKLLELHAGRRPMRAVAARLAIVYGLGPVMKMQPAFMTVANRFAWQACRGDALRVNAGQGMVQLLHLDDAVRALIRLGDWPEAGYHPVNVLGDESSLVDLARLVAAEGARRGLGVQFDLPDEPRPVPSRGRSRLDGLGFVRSRDLGGGLRELLDYFAAGGTA
ncbi:MAG TPA: NAD(P)-dependent oxidoreductase [Chloroflexota bacterium]|nr:NAD(P)-dependent oxidoreductase [Chloroflexota bacterium]